MNSLEGPFFQRIDEQIKWTDITVAQPHCHCVWLLLGCWENTQATKR